ncbi:hypothetical protein GCM10009839_60820 [Catenulispora yoronensis]|uniref:Uncharacterized protein n=1 Tax=Catenulispora yoronensis TaxID=450799 RepID=A0ABN2V0E3_9ACTN
MRRAYGEATVFTESSQVKTRLRGWSRPCGAGWMTWYRTAMATRNQDTGRTGRGFDEGGIRVEWVWNQCGIRRESVLYDPLLL